MIDWPTVAPVIVAWFKYGLDEETVIFENEPRPFTHDGNSRWGRIALESEAVVGTDFIRYKTLEPSGDQEPWILGMRRLTFSLNFESIDQDAAGWAVSNVSRFLSYCQLPLQHDRIEAVDVSFIDAVESQKADIEIDQRMISARIVLVRLYAAFNHRVEDAGALGSWVQSVGLTHKAKTEAGVIKLENPTEDIVTIEE